MTFKSKIGTEKEQFKEGNIPLFFQFYLMFRNQIILGEIEPGARIPPIEELHVLFGVSHATVRKAMAVLEKEGLITKKRGLGTMVRKDVDLAMLGKEIPENVLVHFDRKVIFSKWVTPPKRIDSIFGTQSDVYKKGRIFIMRVLWTKFDQPRLKRVADTYLPARLVEEIGEDQLLDNESMSYQFQRLIDEKVRIDETLRPWICNIEMAELLGIADGTPLFHRTWVFSHPAYNIISVAEGVTTATSHLHQIDASHIH